MASNSLPDALDSLFTLAEDMADGAHTHQAAIGLVQNTETKLRADLTATRGAEQALDVAKLGKKTASTAQTVADSNGKSFIALTKNAVTPVAGPNWNPTWGSLGFPGGSLAIPSMIADRQEMLQKIAAWLTANPAREVAPLGFTAAAATATFTGLSDSRSSFNQAVTVQGQKVDLRDAAAKTLRTRMRGMIDEVGQLLSETDPRWYAFGLNAPGDPSTPGIPDGLVLSSGAPGTVYVDWADSRRAEGYRVFKQVLTVDADFVHADTVTDSDATLTGLPIGKTIKIRITATNPAGESQPGDAAEIIL